MSADKSAVVDQYLGFLRSVAKAFKPVGHIDVDDFVQESCMELLDLIDDCDPTSDTFHRQLQSRIRRRAAELWRQFLRPTRDIRRHHAAKDNEEFVAGLLDTNPATDPVACAIAKDSVAEIERRLYRPSEQAVFQQLVNPCERLSQEHTAYRNRAGTPMLDRVPNSVYSKTLNLSESQVNYAMTKIRHVVKRVVLENDS